MPAKNSAAKRHRQSEKRRSRNRNVRSRIHTEKRKLLEAIEENDKINADVSFRELAKLIDSATNKGVYHPNTADRKKSRLHKKLNALTTE